MTVNEVAAALGSSRSAVRKAIVRGTLAATSRIGPRGRPEYVVAHDEMERYRAEHRTPRLSQRLVPSGPVVVHPETEAEMRAAWGDR